MAKGPGRPDMPALKPYWGKPAVRNFRGDDGNGGIIRSPQRAIVLPDCGGRGVIPVSTAIRAAGFLPPRPHIVAGRSAQMLSRLAASSAATTLWGASAFTAIEHDGRLDGSGRLHSCLLFICLECQRA